MLRLLAKIFIKDSLNYSSAGVRAAYGVLCGVVGIALNLFLFITKLIAGVLSHSLSVIADAVNNASDMASSIVTIVCFKISQKKADEDHPFGHGRMEYIASLIVSFFILVFGWELLRTSINGLRHKEVIDTSIFTIVTLIASILIKFYMYAYNKATAKKISSMALFATARDSLNDTITTGVALVAIVIELFLSNITNQNGSSNSIFGNLLNNDKALNVVLFLQKIPFDAIAGVIVALFIIWGGFQSLIETVNPLLGAKTDKKFIDDVKARLLTHKPIIGVHDFIAHDYGAGRVMISLHAEVPGDIDIFTLHEVIDRAELDISRHFGCSVTIHMDPVDTKCVEREPLRDFIIKEAQDFDKGLSIHDLRFVTGVKRTNVIFDVVPSTKCNMSDKELRQKLSTIVKNWPQSIEYKKVHNDTNIADQNKKSDKLKITQPPSYVAVIHIDSPFF